MYHTYRQTLVRTLSQFSIHHEDENPLLLSRKVYYSVDCPTQYTPIAFGIFLFICGYVWITDSCDNPTPPNEYPRSHVTLLCSWGSYALDQCYTNVHDANPQTPHLLY